MVPQSEAARHGRGAERAVQPCLIGHHQPTVHLPVTPAATQIHTAEHRQNNRTRSGVMAGRLIPY